MLLADDAAMHQMPIMSGKAKKKRVAYNSGVRFALFVFGTFLVIISPIIGAIPGPGFVVVFPIGLALMLQNSRWMKKRYVDFKRRFPNYGKWTDWAMRRNRHKTLPDHFELPFVHRRRDQQR
jgi:hypothetical protein